MNINEFKEAQGLTLDQLAAFLEVPTPTVVGWIYKTRMPSLKAAYKIQILSKGKIKLADWFTE